MLIHSSAATALAAGLLLFQVQAWEDTCSQFHEIYADGTELCEVMWGGAFEVTDDEENAYTMWFFDTDNNPNDAITKRLLGDDSLPDQCGLKYFHKDTPSPEGDGMAECHPWKDNACCHSDTVGSVDTIRESYGEGFEWDRCGPMSQACERFFIQEACFYECEPNAGLYRKYDDETQSIETHPDFNLWQMSKMPIKKSYCDAWYTACYNDYFCGSGDFWECDAHYWTKLEEENANKDGADGADGLTIALSVVGAVAAISVAVTVYLVYREKSGAPVFAGEALEAKTPAEVS
jgi:folate receptor